MSFEKKKQIYHVVDLLKPKKPAKLWMLIQNYMEKEEEEIKDPFEDESTVTIHSVPGATCTSCEG